MSRAFEGSAAGPLPAETVLECGVCWWVYDPAVGDPTGYVEPGTAFSSLPEAWRCPSCDADQGKFMVLTVGAPTGAALGEPAAAHRPAAEAEGEGGIEVARSETMGHPQVVALLAAYHKAEAAMVGLPVHNGALRVEAIGFRPFADGVVGVIVTPWCMNLTFVPDDPMAPPPVAIGASRQHVFPSGTYSFIMGRMEGVGMVETCSLFSPMDEFTAQDDARAAAEAAAEALFEAPEEEEPAKPKTVTRRFVLTRNGAEI